METVYPDDKETNFRKKKYGDIEDILNDKIQCGICNSDLLNEIISKKMIMVHKSYLFLCCYNCFYKLCEGNEFSCILCKSSVELSNCEKCILNICKRCVHNHKIKQLSNGILPKCFVCEPQMLWKSRAQAVNVLKIFYSQLDMPNGLLVNEIEREQTVRKYLLQQSKIGQSSATDSIKDRLCMDFVLKLFKSTIMDTLKNLPPKTDETGDSISIDEYSKKFIQVCELVLEKTCSTLTTFKRIFDLNSQLNPGVSAIMKSLLKTVDEDENTVNTLNCSRSNGSFKKTETPMNLEQSLSNSENEENLKTKLSNTKSNQALSMCSTQSSRSKCNNNCDDNFLKSTKSSSNANFQPNEIRELSVVLERIDNSLLCKIDKKSLNTVQTDSEFGKNEIEHPLELFGDINSSSDEEQNTRKLRNRKVVQIHKKGKKEQVEKSKKKNASSEDEKENNRLTNLNNIKVPSKRKMETEENSKGSDSNSDNNLIIDICENTNSIKPPKVSENEVDKLKMMTETIANIDQIESDAESDSLHSKYFFELDEDIFSKVKNAAMYKYDSKARSEESDDTSLSDLIIEASTNNLRKSDHYCKKNQDKKFDVNDMETIVESNYIESVESDSCAEDDLSTIPQKHLSSMSCSSLSNESDPDFKTKKGTKGEKRKGITSNSSNYSDSSSKYFKKTPMKQIKGKKSKINFSDVSNSWNSNSSSSSNGSSSPVVIKKFRRHKILSSTSESENKNDDSDDSNTQSTPKNGRKNIRKLKKKTELSQLTLKTIKEEESRKKRIEERQKLYNKMFDLPKPMETCKKLVLDFDPQTREELVTVHPDIVKYLKPHQVEGVKFLWNSVFESLTQIKKSKGSGSIIAHCMGLGKTLQIITLLHTLFRYEETGVKTVLVITPNATIENWCKEFHKWLDNIPEKNNFLIFNFADSKTYSGRSRLIEEWQREHGVLITNYQIYRRVVTHKASKRYPAILKGFVDPGPDLVICDEGHLLKNHNSATSKTVNQIKTLRRIVLTGTPLQNNLKEYHCMIDFIRPNLLGSLKDFTNRFINPINNGQYSDSTPHDVKLMKRRSHVLHRMLEGFVQRFDYSVLTPFLPPKHEYVIYLKLANKQIELYKHYLDNYKQPELFTNYNILQMIWTHPKLLKLYSDRVEDKREKQKFKDLDTALINESTSQSDSDSNSIEEIESKSIKNIPVSEPTRSEMDLNWWKSVISKKDLETVYPYSKFIMMFSILKECEEIGDKVLLFSQSLFTLDLIQDFLMNAEDIPDDQCGPYGKSWTPGEDFFRIDGSIGVKVRESCCEQFNDVTNNRMRLLLLSTKAFNLGINLVGANRVIIFDVTWNPSLNVQSIFRVFRFGQQKPCYIYRLVSEGTMEQKIYERQISKLSMSFRVVDEHQIDRHFNAKDQEFLYKFEPNTSDYKSLNLPKDRLMAELILKHKDLVMNILEHDSLLQNNEAEELDENDRNAAWEDYEKERDQSANHFIMPKPNNMYMSQDIQLFTTLRGLFPQATVLQLNDMLKQVKKQQQQNINILNRN